MASDVRKSLDENVGLLQADKIDDALANCVAALDDIPDNVNHLAIQGHEL